MRVVFALPLAVESFWGIIAPHFLAFANGCTSHAFHLTANNYCVGVVPCWRTVHATHLYYPSTLQRWKVVLAVAHVACTTYPVLYNCLTSIMRLCVTAMSPSVTTCNPPPHSSPTLCVIAQSAIARDREREMVRSGSASMSSGGVRILDGDASPVSRTTRARPAGSRNTYWG